MRNDFGIFLGLLNNGICLHSCIKCPRNNYWHFRKIILFVCTSTFRLNFSHTVIIFNDFIIFQCKLKTFSPSVAFNSSRSKRSIQFCVEIIFFCWNSFVPNNKTMLIPIQQNITSVLHSIYFRKFVFGENNENDKKNHLSFRWLMENEFLKNIFLQL